MYNVIYSHSYEIRRLAAGDRVSANGATKRPHNTGGEPDQRLEICRWSAFVRVFVVAKWPPPPVPVAKAYILFKIRDPPKYIRSV